MVVAAFEAEEAAVGEWRGESLVLDPSFFILVVVHGTHEPRVALEGCGARVTQVFEREECDRMAMFVGHFRGAANGGVGVSLPLVHGP